MALFSKEKIRWIFRRHPLLYYARYLLLAKNHTRGSLGDLGNYGDTNNLSDIPQHYFDVSAQMAIPEQADPFDKAMAIAAYLRTHIKGGRGLGYASDKALRMMLDGQGGVCSDFSQVFNNFCLVNDVRVKEWGCIDRFFNARFAHTFNEVYCPRHQKWIAMDVQHCFYFTAEENDTPLSGVELFSRAREGKGNRFLFFVPHHRPESIKRLKNIYGPTAMPFLIMNYRNGEIDKYFNKFRDKFPVFIISTMLILLRKNFHFLFVMDNYRIKLLPKYFRDMAA